MKQVKEIVVNGQPYPDCPFLIRENWFKCSLYYSDTDAPELCNRFFYPDKCPLRAADYLIKLSDEVKG